MNKILKDLKIVSDSKHGNIIQNLYKIPKEVKNRQARVHVMKPSYIYQADLLYLPDDDGFKYALVVVDCATHAMDAIPLKNKETKTVIKAFDTVFKGKYLPLPKYAVQVDDGKEFKGDLKKYFNDKNIIVRYGKPYRHRQQSVVEWMNYILGKTLFMLMSVDEIHTGVLTKDWVDDLPDVIASINKNLSIKPHESKIRNIKEDILPIGSLVRYALDAPINVHDEKKLVGKFRASDIRFSIKPLKVINIFLRPDEPVLYALEGNKYNTYTRDQLQLYNADEDIPKPRKFVVSSIIKKKKLKNKIYYLIKWKGYPESESTWEARSALIKDIPLLIQEFESK